MALPAPYRPPLPAVEAGFASAHVPGRLDRRGKWLFDVAHNPDGIRALVKAIDVLRPRRPLHALVSILGDKEWPEMLVQLVFGKRARAMFDQDLQQLERFARSWHDRQPRERTHERELATAAEAHECRISLERHYERAAGLQAREIRHVGVVDHDSEQAVVHDDERAELRFAQRAPHAVDAQRELVVRQHGAVPRGVAALQHRFHADQR